MNPSVESTRQPATQTGGVRSFITSAHTVPILLLSIVGVMTLYPLASIVVASFNAAPFGADAHWSMAPWQEILSDPKTYKVIGNTFLIAVPRTLLAMALAASFAWIIARTEVPGKGFFKGAITFMFFLPDLPWILAWMMMASPRAGLLNRWLSALLATDVNWIDVFNIPGLIVLGAARTAPTLFLFLYPAFLSMDANLEEAARVSGASRWRTIREINLPLLKPALLAVFILAFVRSMDSFELEQLIGTQAGIYVLTTRIYDLGFSASDSVQGRAMATALLLLIIMLLLVWAQIKLVGSRSYATVVGRGFRARTLELGAWRWLAFACLLAYILIMGALPFVVLSLGSLMEVYGFLDSNLFTTRHWTETLNNSSVIISVSNTLFVAAGAATVCVVLAIAISYVITRTRWPLRRVLDLTVWLPWAIPGLVIGLGYLWAFVSLPIFGTLWILVLVFVARGLPIATQQFSTTMVQFGTELEESARVHGASWRQTFVRILLPLLKPAILGAWVLIFVMAVRVLDSVLVLTAAGTRMLSVDIFSYAAGGMMEGAVVLSLIQTAVIVIGYLCARILLGRSPLEGGVRKAEESTTAP